MFQYDEKFYDFIKTVEKDEKIIMPFILQWIKPKSIVDFGCGEGTWLNEALNQDNTIDVLGIDGWYVNQDRLKISKENFKKYDLRKKISLDKHYDLAISTEVAEHVEENYADIFVDNIANASDMILFSAAIPGQGGKHHVNEQWQSYWIQKFERRGYYCDYSVRSYFWSETEISSWRKQNLLFFSKDKRCIAPERHIDDLVHPEEAIRIRNDIEERMNQYIACPEIYIKLDRVIGKVISQNKRIIIYPYGINGKLCEKILCLKYDLKNYLIVDNNVAMREKGIITAKELQDIDMREEFVIIDTCSNPDLHEEVLKEILRYVEPEKIYSAFEMAGTVKGI